MMQTLTQMWLVSLLSFDSGNLAKHPVWIANSIDSFLVSFPFLLAITDAGNANFINGFVFALYSIQSIAVLKTSDMHGRYYGLRFALPFISGSACYLVSLFTNTEWPEQLLSVFGLMGTANLAFVVSLAAGDFGVHVNRYIRDGLRSMSEEPWMRGAVKFMLVTVSVYLILVAAFFQTGNQVCLLLMAGIVLLSILGGEKVQGSIVSAALALYSLIAISELLFSISLVAIATACYNNFILNSEKEEFRLMHLDIPLLDDPHKTIALTKSETDNSRFRFICNNLILSAVFSMGTFFDPQLFLYVSLTVYGWVLVAPLVLKDRDFHR